jgi:hypothetical protein
MVYASIPNKKIRLECWRPEADTNNGKNNVCVSEGKTQGSWNLKILKRGDVNGIQREEKVAERIREEPAYMGNTKRGKPADKGEEVQENIKGDINIY